jgi:hypothetical protein
MNRCAIIATHHKTGTKWMNSTFTAICRALDIPFINLRRDGFPMEEAVRPPLVLFTWDSNFRDAKWLLDNPEHRLLHLIRDPRDVIISAMHYHRHSSEKWLHVARKEFGGATYQDRLNGLPDDHARYLFEMQHSSGNVIRSMAKWDYARSNAFECKYEALIADEDMKIFAAIVGHLGFSGPEIEKCRRQFWRMSIFGKKATRRREMSHVRSGSSRQWTEVFDQRLARAFVGEFGKVLSKLGYEGDNTWVTRCPTETGERTSLPVELPT